MIPCSCFYGFIKDEKLAFTLNRNPLPPLNIVYVAASTSWNFSRIVAHSTRFSGGIKVALYTLICCYQVNYSCRYQERRQWVPSIYGSRYSRMDQKAVFHKFYVACSWIPWPISYDLLSKSNSVFHFCQHLASAFVLIRGNVNLILSLKRLWGIQYILVLCWTCYAMKTGSERIIELYEVI